MTVTLSISFLLMMFFQILHIFEEIGCGAYKLVHSLQKYLIAASVLVIINFSAFLLLTLEIRLGFYLGLFSSGILAIGNGVVHTIGYLKTRSIHDNIGSGVFSAIPLGILGILVMIQLLESW